MIHINAKGGGHNESLFYSDFLRMFRTVGVCAIPRGQANAIHGFQSFSKTAPRNGRAANRGSQGEGSQSAGSDAQGAEA